MLKVGLSRPFRHKHFAISLFFLHSHGELQRKNILLIPRIPAKRLRKRAIVITSSIHILLLTFTLSGVEGSLFN